MLYASLDEIIDSTGKDTKVLTNADRIRAMSDEELAAFWGADGFCDICEEGCDHFTYIGDCEMQFLRWLKQPVKDGEGDG